MKKTLAFTLLALLAPSTALADGARWTTSIPLDRIASVPLAADEQLRIDGAVRSSFDGSTWNAARSGAAGADVGTGWLDFAAGGLRVVGEDAKTQAVEVVPNGTGSACVAAGVASPCLVPRVDAIAHDRLLSRSELLGTVSGTFSVSAVPKPTVIPPLMPRLMRAAAGVASILALYAGLRAWRASASSAIGRVRRLARRARAVVSSDPTMAPLASRIDAMCERAERLAATRDKCVARLGKIDLRGLERRRAVYALDVGSDAKAVLSWIDAERREADMLAHDIKACDAALEQIASAIAVIEHRSHGERRVAAGDLLDEVGSELRARDAAIAEVEWSIGRAA